MLISERERERERQTDRQTDRQTGCPIIQRRNIKMIFKVFKSEIPTTCFHRRLVSFKAHAYEEQVIPMFSVAHFS